jgi:DNA gyrase subunit A
MAKTNVPERVEKIIARSMEDVMHSSMMPYAEYVILERALPRVEDGLKPVQRRILFTMNELGVTPDKPYRKSARIVGDTLGKYHPHGDTGHDAMVRMAQPFNMSLPLVDGHGNFGSVDGDSAAAMRYTEVRMAPPALERLRDIDKDTVDFTLNFDDARKEPSVLPGRYRTICQRRERYRVGLATNIPQHNLGRGHRRGYCPD